VDEPIDALDGLDNEPKKYLRRLQLTEDPR